MKSTVIAALLGCASAVQLEYRPNPAQSPWAAKATDPPKHTPVTGGFMAWTPYYDREIPSQWTAETDDRLMNSITSKYAVEEKDKTTGNPTGKFWLTKKGAKKIADEVAGTYFSKNKQALADRFEHTWKEVDPLGDGYIPANKGPVFLRDLTDSVEISNNLQLQINEEGAVTNENEYRPLNGVVAPWSVKATPAAGNKISGAYHPGLNYGADWAYERVVPENFIAKCNEDTCDKDDKLMNSIISKYALE